MIAGALHGLAVAAVASGGAALVALALRKPLRRRFGPHVAYAFWAIVPLAVVVALLPPPLRSVSLPDAGASAVSVLPVPSSGPPPEPWTFDYAPWLAAIWLAGASLQALRLARGQRRYVRALGALSTLSRHVQRAQSRSGSPALLGAWRPRIVVPADFQTRFSAAERRLVLAHEQMHRARGDAQLNLLAALLRCVFWFDPLMHLAASRFRFDQELACDARVVARFPRARRCYAGAMLKTQLSEPRAGSGLAVGCNWPASHPLKERIEMLGRPLPGRARRAAGYATAAMIAAAGSYAAWAAQPAGVAGPDAAGAGSIHADFVFSIDGAPLDRSWASQSRGLGYMVHDARTAPSLWQAGLREAEPFELAMWNDADRWEFGGTTRRNADGTFDLDAVVRHGAAVVSRPRLIVRDREPAAIKVGAQTNDAFKGFAVQMTFATTDAPVNPARAASAAPAKRDGDRVASYRSMRRIAYPPRELARRIEGVVYVTVHVGSDGNATVSGARPVPDESARMSGLIDAARAGVQAWKFSPAERAGSAVASDEIVPVVFALDPGRVPPAGAGTLDAIRVSPADAPAAVSADHPPSEDASIRKMHAPVYPPEAVRNGQSAKLQFKVLVDEHGMPQSVDVERSEPPEAARVFAQASIEAIMQSRFNPGSKNGKPSAGYVLVPIDFSLRKIE